MSEGIQKQVPNEVKFTLSATNKENTTCNKEKNQSTEKPRNATNDGTGNSSKPVIISPMSKNIQDSTNKLNKILENNIGWNFLKFHKNAKPTEPKTP